MSKRNDQVPMKLNKEYYFKLKALSIALKLTYSELIINIVNNEKQHLNKEQIDEFNYYLNNFGG